MKNIITSALSVIILIIVIYVNFNIKDDNVWDLIGYTKDYVIVGLVIFLVYKIEKGVIIRCLLFALGSYYVFELVMDILEISNDEMHTELYKKKYINYSVALGICVALGVPLFKRRKKK